MTFDGDKTRELFDVFENEIVQQSEISRKLQSEAQYESIRSDLISMAENVFGYDIKVHFYGSRVIGLASNDSDLDIFVEIGNSHGNSFNSNKKKSEHFYIMTGAIRNNAHWKITTVIASAAVPLITAVYLPMNISCEFFEDALLDMQTSRNVPVLFLRRHHHEERICSLQFKASGSLFCLSA